MNTFRNATFAPTAWQRLWERLSLFLALKLYEWRRIILAQPLKRPISVVCSANNFYHDPGVPEGHILIHAGDLTSDGFLI
ncbi:phosphoesterase [Penicillium soppii]|jgi:hypothetical protein|uniref:phosphoesterase n=1 Tax=Penicillium soppii TaxID=69789 RepID=UPI002546AC1D|nr:phosphoesterase [Penicillium soppii]KAJ5872261.1 phosphoesterase [Penicillium soppii]